MGTILAEFTVMIIQVIAVRRILTIWKYIVSYSPVLLIGSAMMVLVHFIGEILGEKVITLAVQIKDDFLVFVTSMVKNVEKIKVKGE